MAQIETYRGKTRHCLCCRKKVRPNYRTEYAPDNYLVWSKDEKEPIDSKNYWQFNIEKKLWFRHVRKLKIVSREFLGTFGPAGNGFFCKLNCGFDWAVDFNAKPARPLPSKPQSSS